jgi:hypothetical protein
MSYNNDEFPEEELMVDDVPVDEIVDEEPLPDEMVEEVDLNIPDEPMTDEAITEMYESYRSGGQKQQTALSKITSNLKQNQLEEPWSNRDLQQAAMKDLKSLMNKIRDKQDEFEGDFIGDELNKAMPKLKGIAREAERIIRKGSNPLPILEELATEFDLGMDGRGDPYIGDNFRGLTNIMRRYGLKWS